MTSIFSASSFFRDSVQGDKRALLEDISGEEGGTDVSIDERAEGLTTRPRRRLLLESGRKRARCAARSSLAHPTPWTLCVNTHYPSDPSRAKRPSQIGFSHRPLEEANAGHCKTLLPPSTRAETSKTNFPHTLQGFIQRPTWIFEVLVLFLPRMLSSRSGVVVVLLLHPWLPSFSRGRLLSEPSCGFSTPTALLISL